MGECDEFDLVAERIPGHALGVEPADHPDPTEPAGELCHEDGKGALGIRTPPESE